MCALYDVLMFAVQVFEGTEHGFTLQAGPGSERDVDLAYSRANDWFSKYL